MKRITPFFLGLFLVLALGPFSYAEEAAKKSSDPLAEITGRSFTQTIYVVETDEASARESLDRISGKIDLGFSSPDQSYKSEDQTKSGPLAHKNSSY